MSEHCCHEEHSEQTWQDRALQSQADVARLTAKLAEAEAEREQASRMVIDLQTRLGHQAEREQQIWDQLPRYRAALAEDQAKGLATLLEDCDNLYPTSMELARAVLIRLRRVAEGKETTRG